MLSLVTAAEQQYHHDTWIRDRERARLASIRDRRAAEKAASAAPTRSRRAAWARPIGLHLAPADSGTTACAIA